MIFFVGCVAATVMKRVRLMIETDQELLDNFEVTLLGPTSTLLLQHRLGPDERALIVLGQGGKGSYRLFKKVRTTSLWSTLLVVIGLLGLGLGIWSVTA
jgi:hypothetical protein